MKLSEVAKITAGHPFRGRIVHTEDSVVVALQLKDVQPQKGINWDSCTPTSLAGKKSPNWLQEGDILVAAKGSQNYAVLVDGTLLKAKKQAVAAPHFFIVRTKNNLVLPGYLAWLLNQQPCQKHFEQGAEGTLAKSIRRSVLENAPIMVPPIEDQHAIIGLSTAMSNEQQLAEQLLRNSKKIMTAIALDLYSQEAKSGNHTSTNKNSAKA
ncbi:restriction endonuclease subunit S [Gilvimarinus algae]|uniref:Restriction endonuclease subunit S n=1 Tax=Gilvimarinus algae TaxID=3058037 RepID=A0ABT8TCP0_9GAMM|nr:restriction endonuclease subunit S [Gilvimarinus sp. SDUM040014]MDO3380893.1 restriction endonuclease subunit S [Gilvimarinus sp. SDUM040014]